MTTSLSLPQGFTVRPATMDDLQSVYDLLVFCERAEFNTPDYVADYVIEDLQTQWAAPNYDLTKNTWMISADDGSLVGYADVDEFGNHILINPNSCVHPDYTGRGIGSYLLQVAEARAYELITTGSFQLETLISYKNDAARTLLEHRGFTVVRHMWRMDIKLDAAPTSPQWPDGITARSLIPGQDERTFHAIVNEAFSDLNHFNPVSFEDWEESFIKREDFKPELWHLAMDGNEAAGCVIGFSNDDAGWIHYVAVRRPWRHKGLALAMLHHAFGDFYRRGIRQVGLNVDSQNATGATRLYTRAGMSIYHQFDTYEKTLGEKE